MRVITGTAKGKKLEELNRFPSGPAVRPTGAITKEAVFSIIQFDIEGRRVLDLFAGTGQLGIEALSRGAEHCVFTDISNESVKLVKKNIEITGFKDNSSVLRAEALSYLSSVSDKFGIVFLDPPYSGELLLKALERIDRVMEDGGVIVCESAAKTVLPENAGRFAKQKTYFYGNTDIHIYRSI
ncbi:MAG: 16S rRNA (guanine(966)-N(2))-methyltransferase RsmD [Oscillospiraceae bacterium]|nr:16S rRNA (guanine(966)-N(2))-methyltransferase RsmD [Oscillospiraceae bacterium]